MMSSPLWFVLASHPPLLDAAGEDPLQKPVMCSPNSWAGSWLGSFTKTVVRRAVIVVSR